MIRISRVLIVIICVPILTVMTASCDKSREEYAGKEYFIAQKEMGLYIDNNVIFGYNELNCQISVNEQRKVIRIQNDNQTEYVNMIFSSFPTHSMSDVHIELSYKKTNESKKSSLDMIVIKKDGDRYWLWSDISNTGVIVEK